MEKSSDDESLDGERDKNAANQNAKNEGGSDPTKEIASPNGNDSHKSESILALLGALDAGVILLFWGYSEFFGGHNSPILSNICFFGFTASVLAALSGFVFKHWPHKIIICLSYVFLCAFSAIIIYEFATPSREHSTGTNPVLASAPMSLSVEIGASTDPKDPFKTRFIFENIGPYEIADIFGVASAGALTNNVVNMHPKIVVSNGLPQPIMFWASTDLANERVYSWCIIDWVRKGSLKPREKCTEDFRFDKVYMIASSPPGVNQFITSNGQSVADNAILFQITCQFKISWSSGLNTESFKFYAVPDENDAYQWYPSGFGLWNNTNMPDIMD